MCYNAVALAVAPGIGIAANNAEKFTVSGLHFRNAVKSIGSD